ncbi:hypothetical protein V6330_25630, partial [Citrobacter portucalensis]
MIHRRQYDRSSRYVTSKLFDRFRYFKKNGDTFAEGHGQVM